MTTRKDLLARGFLPESLPPIFSSTSFADFSELYPGAFRALSRDVRGVDYSASQSGFRRRRFLIPHPIAQYYIADFIQRKWTEIGEFIGTSPYSLSIPIVAPPDDGRSLRITPFGELHFILHKRLGQFPFIAKSDIRRYFPSIYTHAISWAYHGKAASKRDRRANSPAVFLNQLDSNIRRGQDGQTIGIPIGPDTSRIISEIMGRAIDAELQAHVGINLADCIRHVDDIYMAARTRQEAENCIAALRKSLRSFELEINETKTQIYESASFFDDLWPRRIQKLIDNSRRAEDRERHIFEMFEEAFQIAQDEKSDSPVRYLLRGADRARIFGGGSWDVSENFLLKILYFYPHAIDYVVLIVIWRRMKANDVDAGKWGTAVSERLQYHLKMGHDHEISWLLFLTIACQFELADEVASELVRYPNAVCAILGLHARRLRLLNKEIPIDLWRSHCVPSELLSEWWLFAYEAFSKGWLGSRKEWATLPASDTFARMRNEGVTFYHSRKSIQDVIKYEDESPAIQIDVSEYEEFETEEGSEWWLNDDDSETF